MTGIVKMIKMIPKLQSNKRLGTEQDSRISRAGGDLTDFYCKDEYIK
jgi:hypothetical protein